MPESPELRRPLRSVRVLDAADAVGEAAARLLADLGAETVKLALPFPDRACDEDPVHEGVSLGRAVRNANKATVALDPGSRPAEVEELLSRADIVLVTPTSALALHVARLRERHPHLVVVISSPFGSTGPRADWQATERTLLALSGSLSRSGRPGDHPLLLPDGLAHATAAAHTAWAALVAYLLRRRTGRGQMVDVAHHEALVTGLDPAFGVQGSAAAGRSGKIRRDRPPADSYPVYRCADGYVRLCLLSRRQWRGMFAWLGSPEEFADPSYDSISARVAAADRLEPMIAALFAASSGEALVEEAARRGVPLAQVLTLGEALASEHFTAAGTAAEVELSPGLRSSVPVGCVEVDGRRHGLRAPAAAAPADRYTWCSPDRDPRDGFLGGPASLPFAGLRVLDLGVIVFGAEVGRAFADLGADVVKVESLAFPDGLRQTRRGESMNASFAWGQRNKRSLALDLRNPAGREVFLDLVHESDVVLSNFKPGTLTSLGIGYDVLREANAGVVVLESAAFSSKGPWASRLGYGPLVRAACGISSLWKYDPEDAECWDGVTVYPDHVAARVAALSVASVLLDRESDGRGGHVELGQSDVVLHQLAAHAALESLSPGSVRARGNESRCTFGGLFACAGDDEWAVVEARDDTELDLLRTAVDAPEGCDLASAVATWARSRSPYEVMEHLQEAGIPAAAMVRLDELAHDPQLCARGTFTRLHHPALGHDLPTEETSAPYETLDDVDLRPAPSVGEHTREILREVLGLDDEAIAALLEQGVVHDGSVAAAR